MVFPIVGKEGDSIMVKMSAEYVGGYRCTARHEPSGYVIETDAPADNHGRAERFSPTDLMGAALATCAATTLAIKGAPRGWKLEGMEVRYEKQMSSTGPRRVELLPVRIKMPANFPAADRAIAQEIADNCPAKLSLHPDIKAPITFEW